VVVGTDGSTEDVRSVGKPIVRSEDDLSILLDVAAVTVKVAEEPDILEVLSRNRLVGTTEDDVSSVEIELLDGHMPDDDIVVDGTLEEVPLVVPVIPKVDDERVLYDVENVLNDSETVVGVTVGTFDKLSVDDAVELIVLSSPATVSKPVK
jgi:hypothetical protein